MNDLFRVIFGTPPKDQDAKRIGETLADEHRNNYMRNGGDDIGDDGGDDDDMSINSRRRFFEFSIFNDPSDIHRQFETLINEMNKAFGVFGFDASSSITWEDENRPMASSCENPCQRTENLRDLYLKQPEGICNKKSQDCNKVDVKLQEPNTFDDLNSGVQVTYPRVFSKSVFIQRVQRADGSVETIKKVFDHTGNEETTITQSNMDEPVLPPQVDPPTAEGNSVISFFKKFFSI